MKLFLIAAAGVMFLFGAARLQAQDESDDGSTRTTNAKGIVNITFSPEMGVYLLAEQSITNGMLTNALKVCDEVLATNAAQRWARLARMQVYFEMGNLAAVERDFTELTNRFPNFTEPYEERFMQLLGQSTPATGEDPVREWLLSGDPHKRMAANHWVTTILGTVGSDGKKWLESGDETKQRAALQILHLGFRAVWGMPPPSKP